MANLPPLAKTIPSKKPKPKPKAPAAPKKRKAPVVPAATVSPSKVNPTDFGLTAGLEMPARSRTSGDPLYPFAQMKVGSSFLVEVSAGSDFKDEARKISNRMSGAIRRFRKNNPDVYFSARTVDDATGPLGRGVRVWRVKEGA